MTKGQSGAKAPDRNRGRAQSGPPRRRATYEPDPPQTRTAPSHPKSHRFNDSQLFINRFTDTGIGVRSSCANNATLSSSSSHRN